MKKKLAALEVRCYPNYLVVMFKRLCDGKTITVERIDRAGLETRIIRSTLSRYTIVTFEGDRHMRLLVEAALAGYSNSQIYSLDLSSRDRKDWEVWKETSIPPFPFDHIDLSGTAPQAFNLMLLGGRMHARDIASLQVGHNVTVEYMDKDPIRNDCDNYLSIIVELYKALDGQIKLRERIGGRYGLDLRSKTDAQIAEEVFRKKLGDCGITAQRRDIPAGSKIYYKAPKCIELQSSELLDIQRQLTTRPFVVNDSGYTGFAFEDGAPKKQITIGRTKYTIASGGLHSCERSSCYSEDNCIIMSYDVVSYYPSIILNNKYAPPHIGDAFLKVYSDLVEERMLAKQRGETTDSNSLKITINGSYGKFGSRYSFLYSPELKIQVTITGQLLLLMLIERLENEGIQVISANTDGLVLKFRRNQKRTVGGIMFDWELDTGLTMERSRYSSLYSRDVNNYIAVLEDGKISAKGIYEDLLNSPKKLSKNPMALICAEAVRLHILNGKPIEQTVTQCKDIRKFIVLRSVKGGAKYGSELLGETVRWYYGENSSGDIRYKTNGVKVAKSDGAVPLQALPESLPDDIDISLYITDSYNMLEDVGYTRAKGSELQHVLK